MSGSLISDIIEYINLYGKFLSSNNEEVLPPKTVF